VPLIGRPDRDATLSKTVGYAIGRETAAVAVQMPKPPGVVGRLPEWQNRGRVGKTGCWKIFLDFENFPD
jgi:hypothetical protein